jgi:hypothetical protein
MKRREFPIGIQLEIIRRATDEASRLHCEQCGLWLKSRNDWEIDHVISEGMRPAADRKRRLIPADGRLLCKAVCHSSKTKHDLAEQARAKRREAHDLGLRRPGKQPIGKRKEEREEVQPKRSAGLAALLRRGFIPAGKE